MPSILQAAGLIFPSTNITVEIIMRLKYQDLWPPGSLYSIF